MNLNIKYIDAPSEADLMCAYLVKTQMAYACVSDDMDMFAYDCPIVIRKLSLIHHNCMLYDVDQIKKEIKIETHFQKVILMCGTDYKTDISWDIQTAIERYKFYCSEVSRNQTTLTFYDWIFERAFIDTNQKEKLDHVYDMFRVPDSMEIVYGTKEIAWDTLQPLLEDQGFVYAN